MFVTGHLAEFERTFDDNLFQNAVAQVIGEICDEEGWQFKQVVKAFMTPVLETYLTSSEESTFVFDVKIVSVMKTVCLKKQEIIEVIIVVRAVMIRATMIILISEKQSLIY